MPTATLWLSFKERRGDLLVEIAIWRLPRATADRPHGYKYRLYLGRDGKTLVRYDNETGKGDHRHRGAEEAEESYVFTSVERLIEDFTFDCEASGWRQS